MKRAVGCGAVALALAATAVPAEAAGHGGCNTRACERRTCHRWQCQQRILPAATKAVLRRLRGCETRGLSYPANYLYRGAHDGAYQYDTGTWHEAGGWGRAYQASPAEQDVRTARFFFSHRGRWECRA